MEHDLEMNSIIDKVLPWCLNREEAENWYYNAIIPSVGCTSHEMVKRGSYMVVLEEIERIKDGGFA